MASNGRNTIQVLQGKGLNQNLWIWNKNPSGKLVGVVDGVSLTQNEMGPSNISFLLGWFCTMSMGECAWGIISHRIHLWYIYIYIIWYVIYNVHLFTYIWLEFHGFHVGFQYTSHSHGSVMGISRFSLPSSLGGTYCHLGCQGHHSLLVSIQRAFFSTSRMGSRKTPQKSKEYQELHKIAMVFKGSYLFPSCTSHHFGVSNLWVRLFSKILVSSFLRAGFINATSFLLNF